MLQWDPTITSFADAKKQLYENDLAFREVHIPNDDVQDVEHNSLLELSKIMFDDLLQDPAETPQKVKAASQGKYRAHQKDAHEGCKAPMATNEGISHAAACCMHVVEAAVGFHNEGVPTNAFAQSEEATSSATTSKPNCRRVLKTKSGYTIDVAPACSERILNMIAYVPVNRLVAKDVLNDREIHDFARAPFAFLNRKQTDFDGNELKNN